MTYKQLYIRKKILTNLLLSLVVFTFTISDFLPSEIPPLNLLQIEENYTIIESFHEPLFDPANTDVIKSQHNVTHSSLKAELIISFILISFYAFDYLWYYIFSKPYSSSEIFNSVSPSQELENSSFTKFILGDDFYIPQGPLSKDQLETSGKVLSKLAKKANKPFE